MYKYWRLTWDCNHSNCYLSNEPTSLPQNKPSCYYYKVHICPQTNTNRSLPTIYVHVSEGNIKVYFIYCFCFYLFILLCTIHITSIYIHRLTSFNKICQLSIWTLHARSASGCARGPWSILITQSQGSWTKRL